MTAAVERDHCVPSVTDGEIAARNLASAHRRAWARFVENSSAPGVAEAIVDMERLNLQFLGDVSTLDRLETLALTLARADDSFRSALVQAEVASAAHRFADAREHLTCAAKRGAPYDAIERQRLTINQACGAQLDNVLVARRRIATKSARLEDLVPLGALLADLEQYGEANAVYQQALHEYDGVSPFPPAWTCFQLGMLWGELVPVPDPDRAALWYRRAISYLPAYVKARVHLAEILLSADQAAEAEELLMPALSSGDPEVYWRLADALRTQGRLEDATTQLREARSGFEMLLREHLLAFADHAAEFFAGSGNDPWRAIELARANTANRPTQRAIQQQTKMLEATVPRSS